MITRRTFLIASAFASSRLILPSWLIKAENYINIEEKPFLETPNVTETIIYALDDGEGYYLSFGKPVCDPPPMIWQQLFFQAFGCDSFEEYFDPDDPVKWTGNGLDDWGFMIAQGSQYAKAHNFLNAYDLGFDFKDKEGIGEIDFAQGPCPGIISEYVTVPDNLSLSLLQKRLNQIDGTVQVALYNTEF
jgi:hypothetical protein